MRIISLIASSTEIVAALDFEHALVGRSHECDYPPSVARLPVCTEPKIQTDGASREIDQRVKAVLRDALSVYRVHADKLRELRPDVIITQTQCEVCAVSLKDVEQALDEWLGAKSADAAGGGANSAGGAAARPRVVSLAPNALADVWSDIRRVAHALGADERGEQLVIRLQARMAGIADQARPLTARPTVACIEWIDPLMAAGNWMPELVEMAGGVNLFGEAGQHSPWMTWQELRGKDPDVIVVLPCGWDIAKAREEMRALAAQPGWDELKAVREGRVYLTDGNQYFNRPGPRLAESLEILAEILHPDMLRFGHEGAGWQRL